MGKKNQGNFKMQPKNNQSHKSKINKSAPIKKPKPEITKSNTSKPSSKNLFKIIPEND